MKKPTLPLASRTFLSVAMAATAVGSAVLPQSAWAAAPLSKVAVPGFYRMMLGDFEVTVVSDGTVALPMNQLLRNIAAAKLDEALARNFLSNPVQTSVNTFLINTGEKLVLIDTGAGKFFGPTLGNMLNNLKAAGYQPEQVDEIYVTHMHSDHVGGLLNEGAMAFPNAVIRGDKKDADVWLSQAAMDAAPEAAKGTFKNAMTVFSAYTAAGKYKPFEGNTELVKGVRASSSYGHTPGHTTYVVESKGQKLVLIGDLMHLAAVQFDDPTVTIAFDSNSDNAKTERQNAYAQAAKDGAILGVTHVSFPGLGRVVPKTTGYSWLPVNYTAGK